MKGVIHSILLVLVGLCLPLWVEAQNNPFKIDDGLYKYYQRALRIRGQKGALLQADSFYNAAVAKGDKKAECIALTFPIRYYMDRDDSARLVKAVKRLQEVSRRNDYLQYYYHASGNYVVYLINKGYPFSALREVVKAKQQALEDKHHYGFFSCLRSQGYIYTQRGDYHMAVRSHKEALGYMLRYLPEQDPASIYRLIAQAYLGLSRDSLPQALDYIKKAYQTSKTDESRVSSMITQCVILYRLGKFDEFNRLYARCVEEVKKYGVMQMRLYKLMRIDKAIVDGDYERAYVLIDSLPRSLQRYVYYTNLAEKSGDYQRAYHNLILKEKYRDSLNSLVHSSDLAEMVALLDNERIKQAAKSLELENANLSLANVRLELERAQAHANLQKINAENSRLTLQNRNLEVERLNLEVERQKDLAKEEQAAAHVQAVVSSVVIAFLVLFLLMMAVYIYRRRQMVRVLKERNADLAAARKQAEETDHMKTRFIQNMSHEIRTPLNAIVGFSQLLSSPDMELDEGEKKEFSELIQHNSELLTTLINDVLDLARLESEEYVMRAAPCPCNDVCRQAVASVQHRLTEGVNLYFTSEVDDNYQIETDGQRLQQVLINFLTNAEKHTDEGEIHVHCSLSEVPGKVTFSVTDTGTGVPADKVEFIFNHFSKVDLFKQGTGLGLNICRTIANRLKGEVKYDTSYTAGARFLFILPLKVAA